MNSPRLRVVVVALLAALVGIGCGGGSGGGGGATNALPVLVTATTVPDPAVRGAAVTITLTVSDADGTVTLVELDTTLIGGAGFTALTDLGGGTWELAAFAVGTYPLVSAGVQALPVRLTDNLGGIGNGFAAVIVQNLAPTVTGVGHAPIPVARGATVAFTLTATDADGAITAARADLTPIGGAASVPMTFNAGSGNWELAAPVGTGLSLAASPFAVTLTAVDSDGATDFAVESVAVVNAPPTLGTTAPTGNPSGATVTLQVEGLDVDGTVTGVTIDTTPIGGSAGNAMTFNAGTSRWEFAETIPGGFAVGDYLLPVALTDNDLAVTNDTMPFRVSNSQVPVISALTMVPDPVNPGAALTVTVTATDPDGTIVAASVDATAIGLSAAEAMTNLAGNDWQVVLVVAGATTPGLKTLRTTVTDNSADTAFQDATVTVNALPSIVGTAAAPDPVDRGASVTLSATVADSDGTIASVVADLTALGGAASQAFTDTGVGGVWNFAQGVATGITTGAKILPVTVTDNDGGATAGTLNLTVNNQPPTVTTSGATPDPVDRGASVTLSVTAADADGTVTAVRVNTTNLGGPGLEALTSVGAGVWELTRLVGTGIAAGLTNLPIEVDDNGGALGTGTLSLTVGNASPQITSTLSTPDPVDRGANVQLDLTSVDSDGTLVSAAVDTSLIGGPGFLAMLDQGGGLAWRLTVTVATGTTLGAKSLPCRVTDNDGAQATASIIVTPQNVAPTVTGTTATPSSVGRGTSVLLEVQTADVDGNVTGVVANLTPIGGSASQAFTDIGGGVFQFSPVVGVATTLGAKTLNLTITDNDGATGAGTIGLTVTNAAPTLTSGASTPSPIVRTLAGTLQVVAADADGTVTAVRVDTTPLDGAGLQPMTFNAGTWELTVTPAAGTTLGATSLNVEIDDNDAATGTASFSVTVGNRNPSLTGASSTPDPVGRGQFVTLTVTSSDADGSGLLAGATVDTTLLGGAPGQTMTENPPGSGTFDLAVTVAAGTPAATHSLPVQVTDPDGGSASGTIPATVHNLQVTGVTPGSGPTGGGTAVQVLGTAFTASTTITIDGQALLAPVFVSGNRIDGITPASSAGEQDAIVRADDPASGGIFHELPAGFSYRAPLAVSVGPNDPGATNGHRAAPGATDVAWLQLRLTNTSASASARLTGLTFTTSGTGNDAPVSGGGQLATGSIRLYRDDGTTPGALDGSDTSLATGLDASADNGTIAVTGLAEVTTPGASVDLLVVMSLDATAAGTFRLSVESSSDVTAVDVGTGGAFPVGGTPARGAPLLVANRTESPRLDRDAARGFGRAIAGGDVDADGLADFAVGAPLADPNENAGGPTPGAGSVTVYRSQGAGRPALATVIVAPTPTAGDAFGAAVAFGDIDGDGDADLAVGAPGANGGRGEVYVFSSNADGTFAASPSNPLTHPSAAAGDGFGSALAFGDIDGDGNADLLVGAPNDDVGAFTNAGSVSYFVATGGGALTFTTLFTRATSETNGQLGAALATGDADGDLDVDAVAGIPGASGDDGRVLDLRNGGTALAVAGELAPPTTQAGQRYGESVALGDTSGDGRAELFAGAPSYNTGLAGAGRVGRHPGGAASYGVAVELLEPTPEGGASFGAALAVADFDADGDLDLVVGAPGGTGGDGEVHAFTGGSAAASAVGPRASGTGGGFGTAVALADTDGDRDAELIAGSTTDFAVELRRATGAGAFAAAEVLGDALNDKTGATGWGAALVAGDFDNDGNLDVAVGAPDADVGATTAAGQVIVRYGDGAGNATRTVVLVAPTPEAGAKFGFALAAGDLTGDGRADLVVGAPLTNAGGASNGSAFVFRATAGGFAAAVPLVAPSLASARLGWAVGVGDFDGDGNRDVVAGAPQHIPGFFNVDGAIAWWFGDGSWSAAPTLNTRNNPDVNNKGEWGTSIAVGDFDNDGRADVAAGSPAAWIPNPNTGQVAVVFGNAARANVFTSVDLLDESGSGRSVWSQTRFGETIAAGNLDGVAGDDLVIGSPFSEPGPNPGSPTDAGEVWVFSRAGGTWAWLATLTEPTPEASANFAMSLAVGDFDGDGFADIAAGTPNGDAGATDSGEGIVFRGDGTGTYTIANSLAITPLRPATSANVGTALLAYDFDGDGDLDLAFSATGGGTRGAADPGYLFIRSTE